MTFYANAATRRDIVSWIVLVESMILYAIIYAKLPLWDLALTLIPPLLVAALSLVHEPYKFRNLVAKVEVTEAGVKYISRGEILWNIPWEDVKELHLSIRDRLWHFNIVCPLTEEFDTSFQWTRRSKAAILKYCPKKELIDAMIKETKG